MSLIYLVDGYNVLKRSRRFERESLKSSRDAFLSYLDGQGIKGSFRNRLVVIFDGKPDVWGFCPQGNCEVIFTQGETADEKIKEMTAGLDPKNTIVVTDDRDLGLSVRTLGAKVLGSAEFMNKAQDKKEARRPRNAEPLKTALNIVQREKITQELKTIWLKKKSS